MRRTRVAPAKDDPTAAASTADAAQGPKVDRRRKKSARIPRIGARLVAGGTYGVVPGLAATLGLGMGLLWRRARLDLGATHVFSREKTYGDSDVGGVFSVWSGSARGCYVAGTAKWEVPLCLGVEVGAMRGRGTGVTTRITTWRPWAAALVGGGVAWVPHRAVAVVAMVEGHVALGRTTFRVEGLDVLHKPEVGGIRLFAGIEARFP